MLRTAVPNGAVDREDSTSGLEATLRKSHSLLLLILKKLLGHFLVVS